ncbi:GDSL-type esterase/lipase family protein [Sphingomonas sp. Leaf343]|uniref:GDSL-type esterase/lipase family protein n=1 Tax=Sphingomonas sp. Leaf343 TaxID=1736345 RepID=UPI000AB35CA9|nr:GDSL-type esterase/lipase family protein [Sphingomonas sp. Leaf343]
MRWLIALTACVLTIAPGSAQTSRTHGSRGVTTSHSAPHAWLPAHPYIRWTTSWGSAQMPAEGDNALPAGSDRDITLRQVVRLSAGGTRLRVRLSNRFGTQPLMIGAGHIASATRPGTSRIAAGRSLTFAGHGDAVIPAGADIYSDAVAIDIAAGSDLAISLFLPETPAPQTGHPGSRATSFLASGNRVGDAELADAKAVVHWYAITDVEVAGGSATDAGTVVAIGDSITDGYGVKPERNTRWPDILATRLRSTAATSRIGVVNAGIGGNRILLDGLGPNLMARFDRDVVSRSGVRWAILLEGVNDLGVLTRDAPATPAQHAGIIAGITAAYRQLAARAHAQGIALIGGTITPFGGNDYYHPGPATEADRQAINAFIRGSGVFDAVIDFDALLRDPAMPDRLASRYDSGDHLHPSEAGYRAMGEAVPLALFAAKSVDPRPAIALTFDDIPSHGPLPPGETRLSVIRTITAALAAGKIPAFGFLNAGIGTNEVGAAAATAAWRAAGYPLGNHGWSHLALGNVGAAAFTADLIRNEPPLARAGGDWRWFRYPFLDEGRDPAIRETVRATLAERGYRIAAVTTSFADYDWNAPYVACRARRDAGAIARLEAAYLTDVRTSALAARAASQARTDRDVPQVVLMHVGAFGAHMLPRVLAEYRTLGFRFVPLEEAQRDPFYAAAVDPRLPGPSPTLPYAPLQGPPKGLCG